MTEKDFGKGALTLTPDPRDYEWKRDVGMAAAPFDWSKGYDVEKEISAKMGINFQMPVKDQNGSGSCGGQAWSYLGQVLNIFHDGNAEQKSAKFIYSQTHVMPAGSGARENSELVINQGWASESDCLSYDQGNPPGEAFMQRKEDITQVARDKAKLDKALAYAFSTRDIDSIAQAVRDNHGCIFGITGKNNGTWTSAHPLPPNSFQDSWNHWLYVGKCKMENNKRYFGVLNSWGKFVGENGWQWISEDYINTLIQGYPVVWCILTMVMRDEVVVPPYVFTKFLKRGDRGVEVKMLQRRLGLVEDSIFGKNTEYAVKLFQSAHGLVADGKVGPKTNAELNKK